MLRCAKAFRAGHDEGLWLAAQPERACVGQGSTWTSALTNLSLAGPLGSASSTMYSTSCLEVCQARKGDL